MRRWISLLPVIVLALLAAACSQNKGSDAQAAAEQPKSPPASCPVTQPPAPPFTPPKPYGAPQDGEFWYGSQALWTMLPVDGTWRDLPYHDLASGQTGSEAGYTQKVFWWRQGYDWQAEPEPELAVSGRRLDGEAPPLVASKATNAYAADIGSAMLVGVDIPTAGCWEITGQIGEQELSFAILVVGSEP